MSYNCLFNPFFFFLLWFPKNIWFCNPPKMYLYWIKLATASGFIKNIKMSYNCTQMLYPISRIVKPCTYIKIHNIFSMLGWIYIRSTVLYYVFIYWLIVIRLDPYPNKTVVKMHSKQCCSNGSISAKPLLHQLSNNCFCSWTGRAVETNSQLCRSKVKKATGKKNNEILLHFH